MNNNKGVLGSEMKRNTLCNTQHTLILNCVLLDDFRFKTLYGTMDATRRTTEWPVINAFCAVYGADDVLYLIVYVLMGVLIYHN